MLTILLSFNVMSDVPEPDTVLMPVDSYPDEYLSMSAKEKCDGDYHMAQHRANQACKAWGHISATHEGYVLSDNIELEYMLRVSKVDDYDWVEVKPKIYECKKPNRPKKMLRPWKFVEIRCLTY